MNFKKKLYTSLTTLSLLFTCVLLNTTIVKAEEADGIPEGMSISFQLVDQQDEKDQAKLIVTTTNHGSSKQSIIVNFASDEISALTVSADPGNNRHEAGQTLSRDDVGWNMAITVNARKGSYKSDIFYFDKAKLEQVDNKYEGFVSFRTVTSQEGKDEHMIYSKENDFQATAEKRALFDGGPKAYPLSVTLNGPTVEYTSSALPSNTTTMNQKLLIGGIVAAAILVVILLTRKNKHKQ